MTISRHVINSLSSREVASASRGTSSSTQQQRSANEVIEIHTTAAKLKEAETKIFEIQNLNNVPNSLGTLSAIACAVQCIEAAMLFVLATTKERQWDWYTNYPNPDGFSVPEPNRVASFSILFYPPAYVSMSALEHLCCWVFREKYIWYIERHQNPFRWTEYTFSASLMRVLIAQLVGVTDVHVLFSIYVLTMLTIQCGHVFEASNAKARADGLQKKWRSFWVSCACQASSWLIIFNFFGVVIRDGKEDAFLWGIIIILFLLDNSFAILFILQWCEIGPFKDFVTGEKAFIVLSLTAKSFLAWMTIAGVFNDY